MEQLKQFKANHPYLFWILFPIIAVIAVILFLSRDQSENIKEDIKQAEQSDQAKKEEAEKLKDQANQHQTVANRIETVIQTTEVNSDWYKK